MIAIIWHRQQVMVDLIFQDLSFPEGQFEPCVAYKSVAYEKSV